MGGERLEIVKIPRQAFSSLVEAFLKQGYDLSLVVDGMTVKKEFGCDHCGTGLVAWSPDDEHVIFRLTQESDSVERKIVCTNPDCKKENVRYWVKRATGIFSTT